MEWFENWFDTEYYHLLYGNRDEEEAKSFIVNLLDYLSLEKTSKILDLGCGKGRHSRSIHEQGYQVLGVDLSQESINFANNSLKSGLSFRVGDMREAQGNKDFDAVFSLFTSFGYFNDRSQDLKVLNGVSNALKSNGVYVLDFLNASKVKLDLKESEGNVVRKNVGAFSFEFDKKIFNNQVIKDIKVYKEGSFIADYKEQVSLISKSEIHSLLNKAGFDVLETFGDYLLNGFTEEISSRCIVVAKKN